ncbi:MAG: addiction module protein [Labilithrix sp.]|nr:addiction module protein [Labilithrix sp.]MCW5809815.1 addiction module protein [Labilithrix sp.]
MTRPELAAAIHTAPVPEWHKEELDRRLDDTDAGKFVPWSEARARILGSRSGAAASTSSYLIARGVRYDRSGCATTSP